MSFVYKSVLDRREYRVLTLPNELTCLLIAETEITTAPMDLASNMQKSEVLSSLDEEDSEEDSNEDSEDDNGEEDDNEEDENEEDGNDEEEEENDKEEASFKCAAAMCVRVGHFSDPNHLLGLAHFCEHMLFFSNEKYREENGWEGYLSSHGGSSNASTDAEHTIYQFDVHPSHIEEALDRFAQFFVSPLFDPSALEREIEAVDSEFQMAIQNDAHRSREVVFSQGKENHVFGKFSWGNRISLTSSNGIDLREELISFYKRYYSANQMTLVVLGANLDDLQKHVENSFSSIPNYNFPRLSFADYGFPFSKPMLYSIASTRSSQHVLELYFQIPCMNSAFRTKPCEYLGNIIGHEGKSSLLSGVKKMGFATSLTAGVSEGGPFTSTACWLFLISLELTPLGLSNVSSIISMVFSYIKLLEQGISEQTWNELKQCADIEFKYREKVDNVDYVEDCSLNLAHFKSSPELVLCGDTLFYEYDEAVIRKVLSCLSPDNVQVVLVSESVKDICDQTEPWFGTKWNKRPFVLSSCSSPFDFLLPSPNPFIPSDFTLCSSLITSGGLSLGANIPQCLKSTNKIELFHFMDCQQPKVFLFIKLILPTVYDTASKAVWTALYVMMLQEELQEELYPATLTGFSYTIGGLKDGLELKINGFSDKIQLVAMKIIHKMLSATFSTELFKMVQEQLRQKYLNIHIQSWHLANFARSMLVQAKRYTIPVLYQATVDSTLDQICHYKAEMFSNIKFRIYAHGNCTVDDALSLGSSIESVFSSSKIVPYCSMLSNRNVLLPVGSYYIALPAVNSEDKCSSIVNYYQVFPESHRLRTIFEFFANIMWDSAFDQLRTKEQLGYSVSVACRTGYDNFGLSVSVISPTHHPIYVNERIECYLNQFRQELLRMSDADFRNKQEGYLLFLLEPDRSMNDLANRFYDEIDHEVYLFDRPQKSAAVVRALTKDEMLNLFDTFVLSSGRRKFSTVVFANNRALNSTCVDFSSSKLDDFSLSGTSYGFDSLNNQGVDICNDAIKFSESQFGMQRVVDWFKFKNSCQLLPEKWSD